MVEDWHAKAVLMGVSNTMLRVRTFPHPMYHLCVSNFSPNFSVSLQVSENCHEMSMCIIAEPEAGQLIVS